MRDQRSLLQGHVLCTRECRGKLAEIRIVAHQEDATAARVIDDLGELVDVEISRQTLVRLHSHLQGRGDELGCLDCAHLRARDDRFGFEAAFSQKAAEAFRLLAPFGRKRALGIVAGPLVGIACVRVAQEVDLESLVAHVRD